MVVFPNCKINLGLHVRRKRADGYHDLETIFYPVPKTDILEAIPAAGNETTLIQDGLSIDGPEENNLITKAYRLLKADYPDLPSVRFFLYKTIPMGAGLGGGSADGTFALKLLNDRFGLGISAEKLCGYALQLGSDCPFFVPNKPVYAEARGEKMKEIQLDLHGYHLLIINPGIHISTGWAFGQLQLSDTESGFKKISSQPVSEWKHILYNDFEPAIFTEYPEVAKVKALLYEAGALYASMSGSGSSCFGLFPSLPDLDFCPREYFRENYPL